MSYLDPALLDDETACAEAILAALVDTLGTTYEDGHVEPVLAEAFGMLAATVNARVLTEQRDVYGGFGRNVLGIQRDPAGIAQGTVDIAVDAPVTVPAGFSFWLTDTNGDSYEFATLQDAVAGSGAAAVYGVPFAAVEAGPESNALTGSAITYDYVLHVTAVTVSTPTAGGSDEETIESYNDRIADRAQRVRALPLTPGDYAALALDVPGVARAIATNLRDPSQPTGTVSLGHITITSADASGNALPTGVKTALTAYYGAVETPRGVIVHLADPAVVQLTAIAVQIRTATLADDSYVTGLAKQAILGQFNGAWAYDASQPNRWAKNPPTQLTIHDITAAIDDITGLRQVVSVTVNGASAPIALTPTSIVKVNASDITVTVVPGP